MPITGEDLISVLRCSKCLYGHLFDVPIDGIIGECRLRKMYSDDEDYCLIAENDGCSFGVPRP